jgi:prepilin-type N-terminal cleavage/methylation domain-containing protein
MRRGTAGFTLLEVMTVVAIISILITLSVMALNALPGRARMSGGVLELNAALASARSLSLGRGVRAAVLINTANGPTEAPRVSYWTVLDADLLLDDVMAVTAGWRVPSDLPAPAGSTFQVLETGQLASAIRLAAGGFKTLVSPAVHPACGAAGAPVVELLSKDVTGTRTFPPPFCQVPDDAPCTFCSADGGGPMRGAVFFEPDGRVVLVRANGTADSRGAGSLVLTRRDGTTEHADPRALVMLDTGLIHSFDQTR